MASISRRQLAKYAVDQMLSKQTPANLAKQLAAMLGQAKMLGQVDLLINDINQELEARGLLAKASVTSASRLSATSKDRLTKQIKAAAKVDEVALDEQVDPSVIGGLRIETALHTWDKTIARSLAEIKGGI